MANQVPDKLIGFKVYLESNDLIGIADVELPTLTAVSEGLQGAGIAGELDTPVLGQFSGMEIGINWRAVNEATMATTAQKIHTLDMRGAIQRIDAGSMLQKIVAVKVLTKVLPKEMALGKLAMGSQTDTSNKYECLYIKIWFDGKEVLELDKLNYIFKVDNEDYLAPVRAALGM